MHPMHRVEPVRIDNFADLWLLIKGQSDIKKTFTGELNFQKYTKSMFTKPKFFTLKCYAHRVRISNFTYSMIEYFGEIETEF